MNCTTRWIHDEKIQERAKASIRKIKLYVVGKFYILENLIEEEGNKKQYRDEDSPANTEIQRMNEYKRFASPIRRFPISSIGKETNNDDCNIQLTHDKGLENVRLCVWNIEGLKNKLNDSDFLNYIQNFEIVILVETWLSDNDNEKIISFLGYHKHKIRKMERGGILVD